MINIQAQMKELFGNSCLAYCYAAYGTGDFTNLQYREDIKELTFIVLNGWRNGWIDDDGFVSKPVPYLNSFIQEEVKDIRKHFISSLDELPLGLWIVEYKLKPTDKASHFVIADKDVGVVFDPSGNSNTVKNGAPFSYREVILAA